ncbi:MAG: RecX family transcriptional regulator [Bacilli bacterium]
MKVNKLKKISKSNYKVYFDTNDYLNLHEDVIINNSLLTNKVVDASLLEKIRKENNDKQVYGNALKFLSYRMRSILEVKKYLLDKGFEEELVESTISKLKEQGYLDDNKFTTAFINTKINTSDIGPNRVREQLINLGVSESIIEKNMHLFSSKIEEDKVKHYINKKVKNNHYAKKILQNKILESLLLMGYNKEVILKYIEDIDISNEGNILEKEYNKIYIKYKNKYKDYELKSIIKQKLYQKGFDYREIEDMVNKRCDY